MSILINVLIPILLGGFSRIASDLNKDYALAMPYIEKINGKTFIKLGALGHFVVGGFAALVAINLIVPDNLFKVIAVSILAGFNGGIYLNKNALAKNDELHGKVDSTIKKFEKK